MRNTLGTNVLEILCQVGIKFFGDYLDLRTPINHLRRNAGLEFKVVFFAGATRFGVFGLIL